MSNHETTPLVPSTTDDTLVTLDEALDLFEKVACTQVYRMREGVKAVMELCAGRVGSDPAPPDTVPKFKFECLVDHAKRQDETIARLCAERNELRYYADGVVWHWQGAGQDFPESLTCPVVIPAAAFHKMLLEGTHGGYTQRLAALAEKMGAVVSDVEAERDALQLRLNGATGLIEGLLDHVDSITCQHDSTHRGGVIWTICDDCGKKWADDRGGFIPYEDDPVVARAREAIHGSKQ